MTSHLLVMSLFAALTSSVFAAIAHDAPADQLRTGLRYTATFIGVGVLVGWIMYGFPV